MRNFERGVECDLFNAIFTMNEERFVIIEFAINIAAMFAPYSVSHKKSGIAFAEPSFGIAPLCHISKPVSVLVTQSVAEEFALDLSRLKSL